MHKICDRVCSHSSLFYIVDLMVHLIFRIILRRGDEWSVTGTIRPSPRRSDLEKKGLQKEQLSGGPNDLEKIIRKAEDCMGLSTKARIGNDVLRIEIRGPETPRLTLVDLPGLISADAPEITGSIQAIEDIVDYYLRNPNTILLMIINVDHDPNDHRIIQKVRDLSESQKKTLSSFGIFTKPDLTIPESQVEKEWLATIDGQANLDVFKNGTHVLLNRRSDDNKGEEVEWTVNLDERDKKEREFFVGPERTDAENRKRRNSWNKLYRTEKWGIMNLKDRLKSLLFEHAKAQLPSLRAVIADKLQMSEMEREMTEKILNQPAWLRKELGNVMDKMLRLADNAARGHFYPHPLFFTRKKDAEIRFLRSRIRDASDDFLKDMMSRGYSQDWDVNPTTTRDGSLELNSDPVQKVYGYLMKSRGTELPGNFNPDQITLIFTTLSEPWKSIALEYINKAYQHCDELLRLLVSETMGTVTEGIKDRFIAHVVEVQLGERRKSVLEELEKLESDRLGPAATENSRFWKRAFALTLKRRPHEILADGDHKAKQKSSAGKEVVSNANKEAVSNSNKEAVSNASKKAVSNSNKEAVSNASKEAVSNSNKEAVSNANKEAVSDPGKVSVPDDREKETIGKDAALKVIQEALIYFQVGFLHLFKLI